MNSAIAVIFAASMVTAVAFARSAPPQLTMSLVLYVVLFCAVGQPFNYYWGYVICGIWAHAFVHSWDGVASLIRAALPNVARPFASSSTRESRGY